MPGGNLDVICYEEVVKMARYESSCRRLFDNNVDDVITVEVAGLTLESFFTVIVVGSVRCV